MAFMKRALEKQREEARQEAEKLMQALREEEAFDAEPGVDDMDSDEKHAQQNANHDGSDDEDEGEDSEQAAQIREALRTNTGVVRRQKQKGKSLEVTEHIAAKPMFEAPVIASMFGDDNDNDEPSGMKYSHQAASNLLDDLDDEEEEEEENGDGNDDDLLEGDDDLALLNGEDGGNDSEEEEMQGNPWLLAAEDNVGHSNERKNAATSGKDEETVDIAGTVAKLEVCYYYLYNNKYNKYNNNIFIIIIYRNVQNKRNHRNVQLLLLPIPIPIPTPLTRRKNAKDLVW